MAESTATKVRNCYREVAQAKKVKFDSIRDKSLEYRKRYETQVTLDQLKRDHKLEELKQRSETWIKGDKRDRDSKFERIRKKSEAITMD